MVKLYTYEIDIDTLETSSNCFEEESYDEDATGYAEYEESGDGNRVYAESLVSADEARRLVRDFCRKFTRAEDRINREILDEICDRIEAENG